MKLLLSATILTFAAATVTPGSLTKCSLVNLKESPSSNVFDATGTTLDDSDTTSYNPADAGHEGWSINCETEGTIDYVKYFFENGDVFTHYSAPFWLNGDNNGEGVNMSEYLQECGTKKITVKFYVWSKGDDHPVDTTTLVLDAGACETTCQNFQCPANSCAKDGLTCINDFNDCKCKDGFEKKGDACVKSGIKYGEPIVLKLDVDVIDRYLSGGRSSGNEVVDTRDFRCSAYEKSVFRHHYTWYFESTVDYKNDPMAGEPVKYGDTVYLRVLSNRWLSGGRSSGNTRAITRDFFKNSYEQTKAAVTYRFTVRSTLGNGKLGVSDRNPDPKAGQVVIPGCKIVLQLAGGVCNRWLTGGRGSGNLGVFTKDFYCNAYEKSKPHAYTWRPLLADEIQV